MEIAMSLLLMLGGVAIFMYGMKLMSQGIEQSAGTSVRKLFQTISRNRVMDYGVGIGATAIVQSSSASSIMTVGLANAGIVTVKQAAGIVLGAKVGTTLTAFIFALSGISKGAFSISAIFAVVAFVGVIITFASEKDSLNKIALFFIGFGMLFIGLEVMEFAIGGKDSTLSIEFTKIFQYEAMHNPFLLMLLSIVFTGLILQSSTAATGVFLVFLSTGVIQSLDQAFFLVMGANIGTVSDGLLASIGTNYKGKRTAVFHALTSTMGASAFALILMLFRAPILGLFDRLFGGNLLWSLATYNLAYNTIYTLVLLPLRDPLLKFVSRIVKDKQQKLEQVFHIDDRLIATPTLAVEQAMKEVTNMAALAQENLDWAFDALLNGDTSQSKKIEAREEQIDYIMNALAGYFVKISSASTSGSREKLIGRLHHVINDIENLGDCAVLLLKEASDIKQRDVHFSEQAKDELKNMYLEITLLFELSMKAFGKCDVDDAVRITEARANIIRLIDAEKDAHTKRLSANLCAVEVSKNLYSVLFLLQKVARHNFNIGLAIRSDTGGKAKALESAGKAKVLESAGREKRG